MSRNPEYQFVSTDTAELEALLTSAYEQLTGTTLQPASPERLFVKWVLSILVHERELHNHTANQNIPSRAEGANLEALGELFYETEKPAAKAAVCTVRFHISEPQASAILVPAGTRVTDSGRILFWATVEDAYILPGASSVDVQVRCQEAGVAGNGYTAGQLNAIVDVFDYYSSCENITTSDGGADPLTDDEYYALMRASMDGYSTAGSLGSYVYHAKRVSPEISDIVPNSPMPGHVRIYVLMKDGSAATPEIKNAVLAACTPDEVRPLTDFVKVEDPESVNYDIDFTYWVHSSQTVGSAEIKRRVDEAVQGYIRWQSAKLGRDINQSELVSRLMQTGIKRVEVRSPQFTKLRDGKLSMGRTYDYADTIPQIAVAGSVSAVSGGYEDE